MDATVNTDRLSRWQAEEAAIRAAMSLPPGAIPIADALTRPGIDVLCDMIAGRVPIH